MSIILTKNVPKILYYNIDYINNNIIRTEYFPTKQT